MSSDSLISPVCDNHSAGIGNGEQRQMVAAAKGDGDSMDESDIEKEPEAGSDEAFADRIRDGETVEVDSQVVPAATEVPEPPQGKPRIRGIAQPVPMTRAQREQHWLEAHANYHPSCEFCVRTRGLADRHTASGKDKEEYLEGSDEVPTVSADFCFLSQTGQQKSFPVLVCKEHRKKVTMSTVCEGKSTVAEEYSNDVVRRVVEFLDFLGYPRVAFKTDGERAMTALQERVKSMRQQETFLTNSKNRDSQSNGMIERAIQQVEEIVRTIKLHMEQRMGCKTPDHHPILSWMVEYASEMMNRCKVGRDGKTAYERLRGIHKTKAVAEFGETVLWLPDHWEDGRMRKLEPTFNIGVWLGLDPRNDEVIIGTPTGTVRARTVKRQPEGPRFEAERILATSTTPMHPRAPQTRPKRREEEELEALPEDPELEEVVKRDELEELAPTRRLILKQSDFGKFGYSDRCQGCRALRLKLRGQPHSEECRKRMEDAIGGEDEGQARLDRASHRMTDALVRASERIEIMDARNSKRAGARAEAEAEAAPVAAQAAGPVLEPPVAGHSVANDGPEVETAQSKKRRSKMTPRIISGSVEGSVPGTDEATGGASSSRQDAPMGGPTSRNPVEEQMEDVAKQGTKRSSEGDDSERPVFDESIDFVKAKPIKRSSKARSTWDGDVNAVSKAMLEDSRHQHMETVRAKLGCQADLAEIYSPPRVVVQAEKMKMAPGFSLDFTVPGPGGYIWDFDLMECRQRAKKLLRTTKPYFLVGSPECTPFSTLQNLNMITPEGKAKVMEARRRGEVHLKFCCELYAEQMSGGRYFLHEHPLTAASWQVECIKNLMGSPMVLSVKAHMCAFGMTSRDKEGEGFAKKPTRFLTNSVELAKTLDKQCPGNHRHVQLMEGRAKAAAIYPQGLCKAVCRGALNQSRIDANDILCVRCKHDGGDDSVNAVEYEEEHWQQYWDDLTGK